MTFESDKCDNDDLPSDSIVISGISGRFPRSNNMREFADNLFNKSDMADDSEIRWNHFYPEIPKRSGKIQNLDRFDSTFFSDNNKLANCTDPQARIILEHSFEAILDAGVSPQSLVGSRTGVFVGCSYSDARDSFLFKMPTKHGHATSGNANFYIANRISNALGLCGPSMITDTACSSSAYALDVAYKYIKSGACDAALVAGSQLVLNVCSTFEYYRLRILAADGFCRPFDKNASGFTRADTVCVIFLQKQKDSKRVYANIIHVNSNNDGFKAEGSAFPSRVLQQQLFDECFLKLKMDPGLVNYVEAHSTGTFLGDAEEVAALDGAFCKNRTTPLLIGSVKSNMGHAEASSAIAAIAKIIVTFETQKIPPNINLSELRADIPAFSEGRIKVPTEITDLEGPYISMNSFGLGGANAHALLKVNSREKINFGIPEDDLPRLVCWAGRTEKAVLAIFDDIKTRPLDAEHVALIQHSQLTTHSSNVYRGFGVFDHNKEVGTAGEIQKDIKHFNGVKRPVVWVFSGVASQWLKIGNDLMKISIFASTIDECHEIMLEKKLNLREIFTKPNGTCSKSFLHSIVGTIAVQIASTNLLKALGTSPDLIIGHSIGELVCAYCDGCLTLKETLFAAHALAVCSSESKSISAMATVVINHKVLSNMIPVDIDIVSHDSEDSCTLIGPIDSLNCFVNKLLAKNVFVSKITPCNIALHSRYVQNVKSKLLKTLQEIITNPKKRSAKWLSSTYPSGQRVNVESQYSNAEYHTENIISPVLFHEVVSHLPPNAMTIQIASNSSLMLTLRKSLKTGMHLSLSQCQNEDGIVSLMNTLGQIFQNGIDLNVSKLYPPVKFPVSRGTPMISPVIKWDHNEKLLVPNFDASEWFDKRNCMINISDKDMSFVQGHVIDGKVFFPGTGLLVMVWETLSWMHGKSFEEFPVVFEEVKFLRATALMKNQDVLLSVSIHKGSGNFEITEGLSVVAQGCIKPYKDPKMSEVLQQENKDCTTLLENDFYKEMRLRGYFHKGLFRSIVECRSDGMHGKIKWTSNWTTFIDCLLQFQVLLKDTRQLILPTKFRKLIINPLIHNETLRSFEAEEKLIDVVVCPLTRVIQAGGVEIHEFEGSMVNRRRAIADPVLESYKFISHFPSTPLLSSIDMGKFCVQLLLENIPTTRMVAVEIDSGDGKTPLSEFIHRGLRDMPMVTSELNYLTQSEISLDNVTVHPKDLHEFENLHLIVKSSCTNDKEFLQEAVKALNVDGFIMSRETCDSEFIAADNLQIIAKILTESELLVLMKFAKEDYKQPDHVIKITSCADEWLEVLKDALNKGSVLAYSQDEEDSGLLGFFNCLRRELAGSSGLKCFFIDDPSAAPFDVNSSFYEAQLKLDLTTNVYRKGQWGTYRHLQLSHPVEAKPCVEHFFANGKGDVSSLSWFNGQFDLNQVLNDPDFIKVQYAAINFRDVMQASGKISFDFLSRIQQQCVLGFEFSGVKNDGKRVAGLGIAGAFSNYNCKQNAFLWEIPDSWSLEDAATIPLVYSTVFLAFFSEASIQSGESILIHAGTGGVGLAALHIAFHYGLEVFTTCSTEEKQNFLLNEFPLLKAENIGNSRSTSFEQMINTRTKGRGVDYVLNSLSDDKLIASLRCVAENGTFLEIGKYDILNKTKIDYSFLSKNIKIKTVFLRGTEINLNVYGLKEAYEMVAEHVRKGIIKPLKTTVFEAHDIQNAFRYLASGKHIGKVLVKLRENENDLESLPLTVLPRMFCDKDLSYILVGGLGGFGLELADWLVLRGCRKLVMSSSRGISNGYQAVRIKVWESYGAQVLINTSDITTKSGCEQLLKESSNFGPIGGIFNLAVALRDGLLDNQTAKLFEESFAPKAVATKHLDELSRESCPKLKHFVVFSSVSCGRGNAGQTNYGMANSIMERIIERRHHLGFPAKAIQWGAVGDVGLLADLQEKNMDMQIGGTLPQRVLSCLEVLDSLLTSDEAIVASMVVAEKNFLDFKKSDNIIEALCNILGIRDRKTISMESPLSKLGMDSLMTIEIIQVLEREYNLVIPLKELQTMTLHDLEQRTKTKSSDKIADRKQFAGEIIFSNLSTELKSDDTILKLNDKPRSEGSRILIIPGFEGITSHVWDKFGEKLTREAHILQYNKNCDARSVKEIHDSLINDILNFYAAEKSFLIVAHSFGVLLSLEIAKSLESRDMNGSLVMIDGSPMFFKKIADAEYSNITDEDIQNQFLTILVKKDFPNEYIEIIQNILMTTHWDTKVDSFLKFQKEKENFYRKDSKQYINAIFGRIKIMKELDVESFPCLETSNCILVLPADKIRDDMDENYSLIRYCKLGVETITFKGNHISVLENIELTEQINKMV